MHERKELNLDPSFADNFFRIDSAEEDAEASAALDFPLPTSYETFAAFQASKDGKIFRERVCELIDKVYVMADKKTEQFDNNVAMFKTSHILTDGKDLGLNINDFGLYEKGVPYLLSLVAMLNDQSISLSLRVETARNLLAEIGKCGPGDSIQIARAYRVLKASQSLAATWVKFRADVAEQVLVSGITEIRQRIYPGNDIHYINAIMNHFAEALALPQHLDVLITVCKEPELGFLYDYFVLHYPQQLKIEKLFDIIIDSLALSDWMKLLLQAQEEAFAKNDRQFFNDVAQLIEEKLNRFGVSNFSFSDLCIMSEDSVKVLGLTSHAKTILFQDLRTRLINSHYLADIPDTTLGKSSSNCIYLLPMKSLQFSYVLQDGIKKPFIPVFLELILADDVQWIDYHILICKDLLLKKELALSIVDYFNSLEFSFKKLNVADINRIILALVLLDTSQWYTYVNRLPQPIAKYYFQSFAGHYTDNNKLVIEMTDFFFAYKYHCDALLVNSLLKLIPITHAFDSSGRSVLHIASILDFPEMVRTLINHGIQVDLTSERETTPLMCACINEAQNSVKVLLELKANVNYVNTKGNTALQAACRKLNLGIVKALLAADAAVNQADLEGMTPLHWAVDVSTPEVVNALLSAGAEVNAVSLAGVSVLSTAIQSGEWPKVKALLYAGARISLSRIETVQLLEMLKLYNYPEESASILSILVDQYIEDLKSREAKCETKEVNTHHFSAEQVKLSAKVASSARLFALIEGEARCDSPRESSGLPKVSWKTACENSKRMRFFVETYERLVERNALPIRSSPKL